jgi:hypothetical protein
MLSGSCGYCSSSNSSASRVSASSAVSKCNGPVSPKWIIVQKHTKIKLLPHIEDVIRAVPMLLSGFEKLQSVGLISIQ